MQNAFADKKGNNASRAVTNRTGGHAGKSLPAVPVLRRQINPVAPVRQNVPLQPVVQFALRTRDQLNEGVTDDVAQRDALATILYALNTYKTIDPLTDADFQLRLGALKGLFGNLHEWFDRFKTASLDTVPNAVYLKTFYAEVEAEHRDLVEQASNAGHLPVNTNGLGKGEIKKISEIWTGLITRSGNIEVRDSPEGFRKRTLADFARLLEGQFGRDMLADLSKERGGGERKIIVGQHFGRELGDDEKAESEAIPISSLDKKREGEHKMVGSSKDNSKVGIPEYAGKGAGFDPADFHDFLVGHDDHELVKWGGSALKRGKGTGSLVRLAGEDEYNVGAGDTQIIAPGFVTLGHELGHAQRLLRGAPLHSEDFADMGVTKEADQRLWNNPEEYVNINAVENRIRGEHHLSARNYHAADLGTVKFEKARTAFAKRVNEFSEAFRADRHKAFLMQFNEEYETILNYLVEKPDFADDTVVLRINRELDKVIKDSGPVALVLQNAARYIEKDRGGMRRISLQTGLILEASRAANNWSVVRALMQAGYKKLMFEAGLTHEEFENRVDPNLDIDVEIEYRTIDPKAWFFKEVQHVYVRKDMMRRVKKD